MFVPQSGVRRCTQGLAIHVGEGATPGDCSMWEEGLYPGIVHVRTRETIVLYM